MDNVHSPASKVVFELDFGVPRDIALIQNYQSAVHVAVNFEMEKSYSAYNSFLAIYPVKDGGKLPTKIFYSFETITSMVVVGKSKIVAGTAAGSLLLYDLAAPSSKNLPPNDVNLPLDSYQKTPEAPIFSTDQFSLNNDMMKFDDDFDEGSLDVFLGEIISLAKKEDLVFALDVQGVISTWRVTPENQIKYTGTSKEDPEGPLASKIFISDNSDYLLASYDNVHSKFYHDSTTTSSSSSKASISKFEIRHVKTPNGQPTSVSFHPFLTNVLLLGYSNGDLALFERKDFSVPIFHWDMSTTKRKNIRSVAWSTVRPTVFFVLYPAFVDVWDFSEEVTTFSQSIPLQTSTGIDMQIMDDGFPIVALESGVRVVSEVDRRFIVPQETYPSEIFREVARFPAEMLKKQLINNLNPNCIKSLTKGTKLEIDIFQKVMLML